MTKQSQLIGTKRFCELVTDASGQQLGSVEPLIEYDGGPFRRAVRGRLARFEHHRVATEIHRTVTLMSNARIGFILFSVYLVLYGGFVLLNAFAPEAMEWTPFAGVNLAIVYGIALIVVAFIMAILYGWLCKASTQETTTGEDAR